MEDEPDRTPIAEDNLETIAEALRDRLDSVAGYPVRLDAGEEGKLWVAAREAADDEEAEHALLQSLEAHLEAIEDEHGPLAYRIASGRMDEDLVFVCHFYEP